jgi:hypothetical protein
MKLAWLAVACSVLMSACGSADQSTPAVSSPAKADAATVEKPATKPAADTTTLARYDGYGDMRFGMDDAAFKQAWAGELNSAAPAPGATCVIKRPVWVKAPRDFGFMFEGGRFVRYDVGTAKEEAPGGGKVGMTKAAVQVLYGSIEAQPHKYVDGAEYLRVRAPHGDALLVFETDAAGKVTRWHVGVPPQVDYVEGCG